MKAAMETTVLFMSKLLRGKSQGSPHLGMWAEPSHSTAIHTCPSPRALRAPLPGKRINPVQLEEARRKARNPSLCAENQSCINSVSSLVTGAS